uniref:Uncharacterized protein n=1 Tax=Anguilla anguilla TaxID=7936 RepID=A0A0E9W0C3_ANGAN
MGIVFSLDNSIPSCTTEGNEYRKHFLKHHM